MLTPQITVTPAAEKFIRRMVRFSETPAGGFKLSVAPGGCSGYSSEFSVEAAPAPGFSEVAVGGLRLFLNAESRLLLDGMTMDFAETPLQSGLVFSKPGALPAPAPPPTPARRSGRPKRRCRCRPSSAVDGRPMRECRLRHCRARRRPARGGRAGLREASLSRGEPARKAPH
jgi:iron-sulfur cluster assembly protein